MKTREDGAFRHYYIHVPFCRKKCGYCAFYSESNAPGELIDRYLEQLSRQLAQSAITVPAETIYIGGGTPTLPDEKRLRQLVETLRRFIPVTADTEISMEANPETLTPEKIEIIAPFVTRLSVGVQSFDAARREGLGRDCSDEAIAQALRWGRERFAHLNCDLIYGIGGQSLEDWQQELTHACDAGVDHISCYELTPEENARLKLAEPPDELAVGMWTMAGKLLGERGLARYEISNYARVDATSRHNRAVWRGERYFGLGPAAASFDGVNRWTQVEDLQRWLADAPPEVDEVTKEQREAEIFAVKLRTTRGWSHRECTHRFSRRLLEKVTVLRNSCPEWFETGEGVRLNERGLLFWNSIAEFLL